MQNRPAVGRLAPTALMLGNIVTGCSVLAPAGMLVELSEGFGISIRTAGLLITFGAIMHCVGSPMTAWPTSRIERRTLLSVMLAVRALINAASAFAPDYTSLLIIRLLMLAVGARRTGGWLRDRRIAVRAGLAAWCGLRRISSALTIVVLSRPRRPVAVQWP